VPKARPATISWLPWWLKGRLGHWLLRSVGLLVLVAGFLAGVIWLGHWGLSQVHDQDRYLAPFADIDCNAPESMDRHEFLDEVQYLSRLPDWLNVLDDELPAQLHKAFTRHPWVEKAEVAVAPPRQVTVRLTFRTAVLAVRWEGDLRAVDGNGILLPKSAPTRGLPIYDGTPRPPRGPAGTHWGDTDLERAARKLREASRAP
jgi:hypothetical protein